MTASGGWTSSATTPGPSSRPIRSGSWPIEKLAGDDLPHHPGRLEAPRFQPARVFLWLEESVASAWSGVVGWVKPTGGTPCQPWGSVGFTHPALYRSRIVLKSPRYDHNSEIWEVWAICAGFLERIPVIDRGLR